MKPEGPRDPFSFNLYHVQAWLREDPAVEGVTSVTRRADGGFRVGLGDAGLKVRIGCQQIINDLCVTLTPDFSAHPNGVISHPEVQYLTAEQLRLVLDITKENILTLEIYHSRGRQSASARVWWRYEAPTTVTLGWDTVSVRPYTRLPTRCSRCKDFGHPTKTCEAPVVCRVCAQIGHDAEGCIQAPCCASCGGDHHLRDPACPEWRVAKDVARLQQKKGLSYSEALKRLQPPAAAAEPLAAAPPPESPPAAAEDDVEVDVAATPSPAATPPPPDDSDADDPPPAAARKPKKRSPRRGRPRVSKRRH